LPFLGNFFEVRKDPLGFFAQTVRKYGDITSMRFGPYRCMFLTSLVGIRRVLLDNYDNYPKGPASDTIGLFLGKGLFNNNGDSWRKQRKIAQPFFLREKLQQFVPHMVAATQQMLSEWEQSDPQASPFSLHDEFLRLALRAVGLSLFSLDLLKESEEIASALAYILKFTSDRADMPLPLPLSLPLPSHRRYHAAAKVIDGIVDRIIEERTQGNVADDLLAKFMNFRDPSTGESIARQQLRDEVVTLLVAGHETTATSLSFTFYYLSKHPEIAKRVSEEAAPLLAAGIQNIDDVQRLTYTTRVFQEALRLQPPLWALDRRAEKEDEVCGYSVKPGTIVAMSPYLTHRDPRHWEQPERFDPDRFLPEKVAARDKFAYLPFGVGPRSCIGKRFALLEGPLIVAMVANKYRFTVEASPVPPETYMTLRPRGGLLVRRHRL
jgi:cytochrome P450